MPSLAHDVGFVERWMNAAKLGDRHFLLEHLEAGLCSQTVTGNTALMHCCHRGHADCVGILTQECGMTKDRGITALMIAAAQGHTACIAQIYEYEKFIVDVTGLPALFYSLKFRQIKAFRLLMDLCMQAITENGHHGHIAWMQRILWKCLQFIAAVADPAVRSRYDGFLALILSNHCMRNSKGESCLIIATRRSILPLVRMLKTPQESLADAAGNTGLMHGVMNDNYDASKLLLGTAGRQNAAGFTALMLAVQRKNVALVELLSQTQDICLQTPAGLTALMMAVHGGFPAALPFLSREVGMQSARGKTAISVAIDTGKASFFEPLAAELDILIDHEYPIEYCILSYERLNLWAVESDTLKALLEVDADRYKSAGLWRALGDGRCLGILRLRCPAILRTYSLEVDSSSASGKPAADQGHTTSDEFGSSMDFHPFCAPPPPPRPASQASALSPRFRVPRIDVRMTIGSTLRAAAIRQRSLSVCDFVDLSGKLGAQEPKSARPVSRHGGAPGRSSLSFTPRAPRESRALSTVLEQPSPRCEAVLSGRRSASTRLSSCTPVYNDW